MDATLKTQAEQLANELANQVSNLDLNALMRTMMKSALERMLNTEMDVHLGRRANPTATDATTAAAEPTTPPAAKNRRNGHSQKTVSGDMGEVTLKTPRDRNGTFDPQLVARGQRRLAGFDEKILALYAKEMTTRDIQEIVKDLYGVEVSPTVEEAEATLEKFAMKWDAKYPTIPKSWHAKWGRDRDPVRVPHTDSQGDLHDQRDRECEQRDPQVHPQPEAAPERRERAEAGVPGDPRGIEEVDDADRGVEGGAEPLRHRLRGPLTLAVQQLTATNVPRHPDTGISTGPCRPRVGLPPPVTAS
jgi:putative transposase